jgi:glycine cleavage system H protein
MPDFMELTIDKFTFKVANDRYYTAEGLWALADGNRVRVGVSDYIQQHSGDVAFADVKPAGTDLQAGDEIASIETIKVTISLASPVTGKIAEVNPEMETAPEAINLDPYGRGWLAIIEAAGWDADRAHLFDPQAYFTRMKAEAEEETKSL